MSVIRLKQSGFSLVELMVSVGLIGIMSYGLMEYVASNKKSLLTQNTNDNLKDIEQRIISALQSPAAIRASMNSPVDENQRISKCFDTTLLPGNDCDASATFPLINFDLYTFYDSLTSSNSNILTGFYDKKGTLCSNASNYSTQCPYKVITRFRPLCQAGNSCARASTLVFTYSIFENADTNLKRGFNFTTNQGNVYYMSMRDLVAITNTAQNPPSEGQKPVGLNPDGTFIYDKGILCERKTVSFDILANNSAIKAGFVEGEFVAKLCGDDEYAIDGTGSCLAGWTSNNGNINHTSTLRSKTLTSSQLFSKNSISYPQYWAIRCQDKRVTQVKIEATCCKTTEKQGSMPAFNFPSNNSCKIKPITNLQAAQGNPNLTHPNLAGTVLAPSILPMDPSINPIPNLNRNRPYVGDRTPSWPRPILPTGVATNDYWEIINLWVSNRLTQMKDSNGNYFDDAPYEGGGNAPSIPYNVPSGSGKQIFLRPYLPANTMSGGLNFNSNNCNWAKNPDNINDAQDFQQCHNDLGLGGRFSFNPSLFWNNSNSNPTTADKNNWVLTWPIGFDNWRRGFMEWTWVGGQKFSPGNNNGETAPYGAMTENPCQQGGDDLRYEGLAGGDMLWDQFLFVIQYHPDSNGYTCSHPKTWGYAGAVQAANNYGYPAPPTPANFMFEKIETLNPAMFDFRVVNVTNSTPFPTTSSSLESDQVQEHELGKFLHSAEDYGLPFPAACHVGARLRPIVYAPRALCCPNY